MMKATKTTEKGFTLVETLVSITILLIVITGPMTISMSTARSTSFSSEQVVAFFLAQEGIEIAQMARDQLLLRGLAGLETNPWGKFSANTTSADYYTCFKTTGCGLELNTNTTGSLKVLKDCDTDQNKCRLYTDATPRKRARYTYVSTGNNAVSPYTRSVYFYLEDNWDVKVVSKVTWRTGIMQKQQEVKIETHLFNIYDK